MTTKLMTDVAYNMAQRNYHVAMGFFLGIAILVIFTMFAIVMMQKLYAFKARRKAQQFIRNMK